MLVAPAMTWLLVRISPDEASTMPVPAAAPLANPRRVVTSTTPGSTFDMMSVVLGATAADDPPPDEPDGVPNGDPLLGGWSLIEVRPIATTMTATALRAMICMRRQRPGWRGGTSHHPGGGGAHGSAGPPRGGQMPDGPRSEEHTSE